MKKLILNENLFEADQNAVKLPRIEFTPCSSDGNFKDITDEVLSTIERVKQDPSKVFYRIKSPYSYKIKELVGQNPELLDKVAKRYISFAKKFLKDYSFNPQNALYNIMHDILSYPYRYVENTSRISDNDDEVARVVEEALKKYMKQVGTDRAYEALYNCWNEYSKYPINVVKYEYVRPEDIGKSRTSSVVGGTFAAYYYYQVEFDIAGDKVEFIRTVSQTYSGGWN